MNTDRMTGAHLDKICAYRRTERTEQVSVSVFVPRQRSFQITECLCAQLSAERKIGEESRTEARAELSVEMDPVTYSSHAS
jgi:hypothetical protein